MRSNFRMRRATLPAAILAFILLLPLFIGRNNYYMTIGCQAMLYAIVALGLNFIVGMAGNMSLGTAAVFGIGAYISALLSVKCGWNPWLCLIPVIAAGWLIGRGLGYPSLRLSGVYLSLVTIGFNTIVQSLLTNLEFTGRGSGVRDIPDYSLFGLQIDTVLKNYYFIFIIFILFILVANRIVHSKWGRAFVAIKDNPDALSTCGIDIAKVKITAFTLSSIFACIAGAVFAHFYGYVAPNSYSTSLSISFVVMLILGGLGNFWGCIMGAYIVAFVPQLMRVFGTNYRLVYALLIMIVVILFPNGILQGIKAKVIDRIRNGRVGDKR